MKPCSTCGEPKELSCFGRRKSAKDGYHSRCKLCESERNKKWHENNKERRAKRMKEYYEVNKEQCSERSKKYREANKEYYVEHFKKYYEANKEQCSERSKKYREANKEQCSERSKKYREANKEYYVEHFKKYYESNKDRFAERSKIYRKANPDKTRSSNARRRSVKLQAHPPWAATLEKRQIEGIYTLAKIQSEATGKEYHVDHIHPLQAPKVVMFEGEMIPLICGLHVPSNLQILEASVNCSKNNKFEPYIESECDFTELWQVRSDDRILIPTPIDRVPRRNPSALIKPRKSRGVSKGQLVLF